MTEENLEQRVEKLESEVAELQRELTFVTSKVIVKDARIHGLEGQLMGEWERSNGKEES